MTAGRAEITMKSGTFIEFPCTELKVTRMRGQLTGIEWEGGDRTRQLVFIDPSEVAAIVFIEEET